MSNKPTVLQKFWTRVLNEPDRRAILIKNPDPKPNVVIVPAPVPTSGVLLTPPAYVPVYYEGIGNAVAVVSALLRKNGFQRGDRAAIMAWNCPEWMVADLAIQSLGGITVPIYPHSTPEQVNYVVNDSGAKFLFSNESAQLEKVDSATGCTTVLFNDIPEAVTGVKLEKQMPFMHHFLGDLSHHQALRCAVHAEFRTLHGITNQTGDCGVTRDDVATLIYTSGSTGVPKGVILDHGCFASGCEGMLAHGFALDDEDVYVSYLPLAHVYERACGMNLCIWTGTVMAFCTIDEVAETLKLVRPTLMHGVPAVWRKTKDKIDAGISESKGLKRKLIDWAFAQKKGSFKHFFADLLVFSKIRAELGGRLRLCTSGGAGIAPEIVAFYQTIGIEILQGYGLTETTGASVVNRPSGCAHGVCNKVGAVGTLISEGGLEMRIVPVEGIEGDGEIQFRGPTVMKGYWKLDAETKKTFTEDGWFKTGDLGRVDKDGFLYITGRIKRQGKTEGGKYVSPEKIEKLFEQTPIVQYTVPIIDGRKYVTALMFINQVIAKELLAKAGVSVPAGDAAAFIAKQPQIVAAVQQATDQANEHLERWEQLKYFTIVPVEAGIANGLLTPTLKIRTEEVLKRYKDEVESMYGKTKA